MWFFPTKSFHVNSLCASFLCCMLSTCITLILFLACGEDPTLQSLVAENHHHNRHHICIFPLKRCLLWSTIFMKNLTNFPSHLISTLKSGGDIRGYGEMDRKGLAINSSKIPFSFFSWVKKNSYRKPA